ncbi:serine/threonine-protein kinase, partial [Actinoplanes campanulatus]|uniref:serine/threonine-protein kinase n=1 Tax=Actinoplanes campanulatus TaxID=113559 RepID=UPI0031D13002
MAVRQMLVAGRYRLLEPVGAGGMGRVWLARDEMLHREVAVKEIVPPDWMTGAEKDRLRSRTLREARSAARLNHPHVVRIYDVVHAEGLSWIVMEYVQSRSLQQVLHEEGPYEPAVAARIGLAVLDALAAAHRAGVLHRDVKPHNVLIGTDGRVVLTDFGLATFVDDGSVTAPGLIVGSPQYVSPERARDGASTVESDLWSLGATLYAAVEGRSPYARETAMATLAALATEPPDPAVRAGPLASVLDGLLRYEPATRLTVPEVERRLRMIVFEDPREKIPFLPGQRDGRRPRGTTGPKPVPRAEPGSPHAAGSPARPHRGTAPVAGRSSPHASPAAAAPETRTHIGRPRSSPDPVRRATGAAPVPPPDGAPSPGDARMPPSGPPPNG